MPAPRPLRRALTIVAALALLTGCGSSSGPPVATSATAEPAAMADVTTVTWPTATDGIQELAARLPREIAGLTSDGGFTMDETFPVVMSYGSGEITYDGATASPVLQIAVMNVMPGGPDTSTLAPGTSSPGGMLFLMFGLNEGCAPDTVSSDPPMQSDQWKTETARTVWFTCQVGMVQNHGELTGAQRRHLAGWAGPGTVAYLVDAPTQQAREEAVSALVSAARST